MESATPTLSLPALWTEIWGLLGRGSAFHKDPCHTPQLSTWSEEGPSSRIVILRKADKEKFVLICHTDIRSQKVKEIQKDGRISWLFWNPNSRIQVRITANATLHHLNDVTQEAWKTLSPSSRTNYSLTQSPGEKLSPGDDELILFTRDLEPSEDTSTEWYRRFAVIETVARQVEWLHLSREGHRRARFVIQEHGLDMHWLVP